MCQNGTLPTDAPISMLVRMKNTPIYKVLTELFPHKNRLIVIVITGVLMSLSKAQMNFFLKQMFDALQNKDQATIYTIPLYIIGLALVLAVSRYFHLFNMDYVGELASQQLRKKLQMKFMRLNLSFLNTYAAGSGGLISRILNDISTIQNGYRMFADFFREPILFFLLFGYLFYVDAKLTLSIVILLPLILLFLRKISKSLKKYSERGQEDLEKITSVIKESLDGVRIIQSFQLEKEMENKFDKEFSSYLHARRRFHSLIELSGPVTEFVTTILIMGIFVYMCMSITNANATLGDFISYLGALLQLSEPIKKLQESYVRIQEVGVASRRVFEIVDDGREVPEISHPKTFPDQWSLIEFKNVNFSYGEKPILKNVNLKIHRGEVVAFVGSSGSGKSTLVNLLGRFFDPSSGEILIDGVRTQDFALKDLRAKVALVTQDVFLFSDTIEKNIWAGDFSKNQKLIVEVAKKAHAHDFIMKSENQYQTRVGDRGGMLSGGEKQRISIARAILKDAPLLILDEATSALDSVSEIEVQAGLDSLMAGRTTLVIAHRLSTINKADKIVVMKDGQIVEVGNHQELLALGKEYHQLYTLQRSM